MGLFLGIMLALQFKITSEINRTEQVERTEVLATQLTQLKEVRDLLQEQVNSLRTDFDRASAGPGDSELRKDWTRPDLGGL